MHVFKISFNFIKKVIRWVLHVETAGAAAQLAYFLLLSLFPFLLFIITLIGYLSIDEQAFGMFIEDYAPEEIKKFVHINIVQLMNNQNGGLLSIGILGTLWSASNGINVLTKVFNKAYMVKEDRSFLVSRLISVLLTLAMLVVILVAFLLPIFGKMIGVYFFSFFGLTDSFNVVWNTLRWAISSIIFFTVLSVLYKLAPNIRVNYKHVVIGATFATFFWQLVSLAFSYYVGKIGNYSATYGSLGGVIILMVWFYISGIIIISGGVLNAVILQIKKEAV